MHLQVRCASGARYHLKEKSYYLDAREYRRSLDFQAFLGVRGARVEAIERTSGGGLALEHEGRLFRLARWVDGGASPCESRANGLDAGRSLAHLHDCAAGYVPPRAERMGPRQRHRTFPRHAADWHALLDRFLPCAASRASFAAASCFQELVRRVRQAHAEARLEEHQQLMIHGDAHQFNLLAGAEGGTWVDLEDARLDAQLVDVVWLAVLGGCYEWTSLVSGMAFLVHPKWAYMQGVLCGYLESRPVRSGELAMLPALFELYLVASLDNCTERVERHRDRARFLRDVESLLLVMDSVRDELAP